MRNWNEKNRENEIYVEFCWEKPPGTERIAKENGRLKVHKIKTEDKYSETLETKLFGDKTWKLWFVKVHKARKTHSF